MDEGSERFNRHSIRLKEFDYASVGAYFVTVVTQNYLCILGKIISGVMQSNPLGRIAQDCWKEIPVHFPDLEIEPHVIMPNHIHGIITIHEKDRRGTIMPAHAGYRAPTTEKFGKPVVGSIPTIIRTYKASVSRRARREMGMVKIWQRNYYERIIRNDLELERISGYILDNPLTWADDPENRQLS